MIRIVQIGIGPLGRMLTGHIVARPNMTVVAAVDNAPHLAGRDLGELCSLKSLGVPVSPSVRQALSERQADLALLTTVSDLDGIVSQIQDVLGFGLPVVSSCEELAFPWKTSPKTAARIDSLAKEAGAAVLATGVNPGFMMDTLPVLLSGLCQRVDAVKVSRIQDASTRRLPFQRKIGAGLSLEQFEERRQRGALRHVGLTESMHMISSRIGWRLDRTEDLLSPVVARQRIEAGSISIEAGMAAGVQQTGRGFIGREEKITLIFRASVGEPSPEDVVELAGLPPVVSRIAGGVHGDIATCAILLNAAGQVLRAQPGLRTMVDLPPVSYFLRNGNQR